MIFYFACSPKIEIKSNPNYIVPAEVNYRKYFKSNFNSLEPLEGIWTEYVVGTLYDGGKVIERKEIAKRARWIVIKKGSYYNILNEYTNLLFSKKKIKLKKNNEEEEKTTKYIKKL